MLLNDRLKAVISNTIVIF